MKIKSFLSPGLLVLAIGSLLMCSCKKDYTASPVTTFPNLLLHGFEIKDTLNTKLIDSNFSFNADGSLYSAADLITNTEMDFTYLNGQRQSNPTYSYLYTGNNLSAIAIKNGQYQLDSLLLYPNGYIKQYKHAFDVSQAGVAQYITYNYNYGNTVGASGPVADPISVLGKGVEYDNAGRLMDSIYDYYQFSYNFPFNSGFTPLMSVCNDSKVHFLNLRLWCDIPVMNTSEITQVVRIYSNQHGQGIPTDGINSTDNFTYVYDGKLRPVAIIKNGKAAYTIIYHD
jgi:hypothetical protein